MPSKTKKQAKFMRAAAHNTEVAAEAGIPQSVAREYVQADARKTKRAAQHAKKKGGKR